MNKIAPLISLLCLTAVVLPCILYFLGSISLDTVKWAALVGTIGWFAATPFWMGRQRPIDAAEVEI